MVPVMARVIRFHVVFDELFGSSDDLGLLLERISPRGRREGVRRLRGEGT